jgi:phage baseplate assembly protein W
MAQQFQSYPSQIDTEELKRIKQNFSISDNIRSERSENLKFSRENPEIIRSGRVSTDSKYGGTSIKGLSYPLELNGAGGLKTSENFSRLSEQIREVLDTKVGERVYRQFFGLPELVFETISEAVLSQIIKKQLKEALPFDVELDVSVEIDEDGRSVIYVGYSLEQSGRYIIKYSANT